MQMDMFCNNIIDFPLKRISTCLLFILIAFKEDSAIPIKRVIAEVINIEFNYKNKPKRLVEEGRAGH